MTLRRYRRIRIVALWMAALPLLQFGPCGTAFGQIFGGVLNSMPAIFYNAAQSTALLPAQFGLALLTGGFGGSGSGGGGVGSGSGLGGSSGFGGSGSGT